MTHYDKLQSFLLNNQKVWLITGVAGFIGSNLLEKLLILDQKVVGLDSFDTGFEHNINQAINDASNIVGKDLKKNFNFIHGNIKNLNDCIKACNGVDYVLHQAAIGSVPRSIENPIETNASNINGFLNMLIASRDAKVDRFVYAASSSSYGDNPNLPKTEDIIGNPLSPYAVTKYVNELYAAVFAENYGFKTIGLRYFNIFGKRQDPGGAYAAVIPKWINAILNNNNIYIYGDGKTSRDFCYIDNAVQINLLAATTQNNEAINQVYNVALNDRTSLNDLYNMIQKMLIKKVDGIQRKNPIYKDFRAGDVKHSQASIDKAKRLLEYDPQFKISNGMKKTINWYINTA